MSPKILIYDIETSPHKAWSFGVRNTNIFNDQIIEPTRMICWAAKWLDKPGIMFRSEYHHDTQEMREVLHRLLDEADATVTYNGDRFDNLHVQREFHQGGLAQPSPFVSIDLFKVIRRNEVWASHKMDYVTKALSLDEKLAHHGFMLWRECLGDFGEERQLKSWSLMRRYNKQDIRATEALYNEYLPLINNMPGQSLFDTSPLEDALGISCPTCGSYDYERRGYRYTKTRRYVRYTCRACHRWFSDTRSDASVSVG